MSNYSELLKDPRWQKKRLEILALDYWRCRRCDSKTKTLHVHHQYYIRGNKPWEYPNDALVTLCEDCHKQVDCIDWQKAFLDTNMTPQTLLDLALAIKYYLNKQADITSAVQEKYNTRYHSEFHHIESLLADSEDDLFHMLDFVRGQKKNYTNG